ncbi:MULTISPECIES: hypothetical protein [unclassified Bordetella]|uniref:hypothetical protein n=1 Tax=unclassified Bordetella TaxID=2630031 RepID=UPI0013269D21|nr:MULTISPECIES: hypothetical protein [unclassified Bordetella]MVW70785.1 hypothetical protein [Bordetella sp. 15P40C-2]MVW80474.1 hypothetical protein [Bordetella sp. 02P26C-1]
MSQTAKPTMSKTNTLGMVAAGAIVALAAALPLTAAAQQADYGSRSDTSAEGRKSCARKGCAVDFSGGAAGQAYKPVQERKTSGSAAFDTSTQESGLVGKIRRVIRKF